MTDEIFLLRGDHNLVAMVQTPYAAENILQELLAEFPTVLTGGRGDAARWLLISREVAIPSRDRNAGAGYLDHLFLDQHGIPTLVEVKRSSDSRARREVVGQLLDYASNAVFHWEGDRIREIFERRCQMDGLDADVEVTAIAGLEQDIDEFWEQAGANLKAGRIRLVFVADEIPEPLQRIVEFLNEHLDSDVIAIEVKQYVAEGMRTLVPRVVGDTAAARGKRPRSERRQWDEATFLETLTTKRGEAEAAVARELIEWARREMSRTDWGHGSVDGSFIPILDVDRSAYYPLVIYTYGRLEIQFQHLTNPPFDDLAVRRELLARLNEIPGVSIADDAITRRPSIPLSLFAADPAALSSLGRVLDWFCARAIGEIENAGE